MYEELAEQNICLFFDIYFVLCAYFWLGEDSLLLLHSKRASFSEVTVYRGVHELNGQQIRSIPSWLQSTCNRLGAYFQVWSFKLKGYRLPFKMYCRFLYILYIIVYYIDRFWIRVKLLWTQYSIECL